MIFQHGFWVQNLNGFGCGGKALLNNASVIRNRRTGKRLRPKKLQAPHSYWRPIPLTSHSYWRPIPIHIPFLFTPHSYWHPIPIDVPFLFTPHSYSHPIHIHASFLFTSHSYSIKGLHAVVYLRIRCLVSVSQNQWKLIKVSQWARWLLHPWLKCAQKLFLSLRVLQNLIENLKWLLLRHIFLQKGIRQKVNEKPYPFIHPSAPQAPHIPKEVPRRFPLRGGGRFEDLTS